MAVDDKPRDDVDELLEILDDVVRAMHADTRLSPATGRAMGKILLRIHEIRKRRAT